MTFSTTLKIAFLVALLSFGGLVLGQEVDLTTEFDDLSAGFHYDLANKEVKFNPRNKNEIVEVFSYGCSHCRDLEQYIPDWKASLPSEVNFLKVPVSWRPVFHATLFWTLISIGREEELTPSVFRTVAGRNNLSSLRRAESFLRVNGISFGNFNRHMNSFYVKNALRRSEEVINDWGVSSTPTLVVNGKYVIPGSRGGRLSHQDKLVVAQIIAEAEKK